MNHGPILFLGILLTLASSWCGLILAPQLQIGGAQPVMVEAANMLYPPARPGEAQQGAEVYRANGCFYCHTQMVRGDEFFRTNYTGLDIQRGWGIRPSTALDYLIEYPVMLGQLRLGPDLTNVGARQPDRAWHLAHLYDPKLKVAGSLMPRYPYLFNIRKLKPGEIARSPEALDPGMTPGFEVVPKPEARALAAYLASSHITLPLFESPLPQSAEAPSSPGGTNATTLPVPKEASAQPGSGAPLTK